MLKKVALAVALIVALPAGAAAPARAAAGINHDFDWNVGTWKTHIRRLLHPLSGSNAWASYEGVVTVRPLLGGAANVEEVEADGAGHLEFMAVRTFNPQSHQWILNQADGESGSLGQPAYGAFDAGRGVFYDVEPFENKPVLVRQTFYDITPSSYAFEQAYSNDGGKSWEPNFRANLERTRSSAASEGAGTGALSHDFDFNYGTWRTNIRFLRGSLDAPSYGKQTGTVTLRKVWNGRGLLEEIVVPSSDGFAGLTLYLYDPRSREWSQTYADSSDGTFGAPMVGTFSHGRAELFAQDTFAHKMVLQRGVWSDISANAHHFEIDVSKDGGASWHPVFIASLTRIGPGA